jgi:hypothetical protein
MHQNLDMWETLELSSRRRFEVMFRHWKSIGQVKPRYSLAMRRCKMHKALFGFVYRSGRQAVADWGSKLTPALSTNRTVDVVQRIAFDARLRFDYLQSLIMPAHLYSLPCVRNLSVLEDASSTSVQIADDMLHALADSVDYFEVVDTNVARRKVPQTEGARGHRLRCFPVSLQQYTLCAHTADAVDSVTLRAHGVPHARDLMDVAPWPVWRGWLRYLPHSQGTLPGIVSTGPQVHLSRRDWDMASLDTPCLDVLEHLVQGGWSVGTGPTVHTPASPRVFTWREDMSQKPYWQCLATLDSMFAKGLLQFRSGLPHYYDTAGLCAAAAQALALAEADFEPKVGAPQRLVDCQNVHAIQREVLGGDGPMRTAWRRDLTHAESRARTSVKRPWDCVSHESAVTLDTQSCVIPLVPQATLAATSELVTRTNALNLSADTSGEGDTHGASSGFPKPAMLFFP